MKAYFFILIATLCWGANTVFGLMAVNEVSPMLVVSARWLGVTLLVSLVMRKQIHRDWSVLKQHWAFILIMGASGYALFNGLYYVAAHNTTAINLGIIQGSIPVFVLLGTLFVFKTTITRLQIIGVFITLIGVFIVTSKGELQLLLTLVFSEGDLLMLVACFFYAVYTIGLKYRPKVSSWSLFAAMGASAFLISIPMSLIEASLGYTQFPTSKGWLIIALITLLPSLLAQIAFIQGVKMIGPERASLFINLIPIFSALFAVLFLGEFFELYHGIALGMVLGGIALAEFSKS
jgi:drug/metabolite transporter (DMT)-like permease